MSIENSILSEMLASRILEKRELFAARAKRFNEENVALVEKWIETREDLDWVKPDAGLISFPKFDLSTKSVARAKRLVEEQGVAIGPGDFFNGGGHLRLCFTRSLEEVSEALQALGLGLARVSAMAEK